MTIIPYFDPILGKLRNSDVALISTATLIVTDPLVVNNLIVNSTASINQIRAKGLTASLASINTVNLSYQYWNTATASLATQEGLMHWDSAHGYLHYGLPGGNVDANVGMGNQFPRRVKNSTGSTMAKGTVVYINGVSGNTPTVERAIATGDMTSAFTLGMTAESIPDNNTGWVTTFGVITGIDLSTYSGGDTLYLSGATAGLFTNQIQLAPTHYVRVGTVVKATTDGELVVNVINGYELNELHNVVIASQASGQILISGASQLWYNKSLSSVLPPSVSALASLTDVSFVSLATSNYLQYNGAVWTNADIFSNIDGGSSSSVYLITQNINGGNA